ncbi:MAG: PH domain-containing protein [Bacteroidota bacterium]
MAAPPTDSSSAADSSALGASDAASASEEASPDPGNGVASDSSPLGAVREPQALHPLTLLLRLLTTLPALALILLPTLTNNDAQVWLPLFFGAVYGLIALPAIVLQYLRFSYRITPQQIVIQSGVLNRKNRSIPIERIQNVEIEQQLLARMLNLAQVRLETAGSASTEASIEYVSVPQAQKIRAAVRTFQRDADPPKARATPSTEAEAPTSPRTLFSMSLRHVLLAGAFRFSLFYLALIFSVLQFVDPETLTNWLLLSQDRIDTVVDTMYQSPVLTVLSTVLVAALLGWLSGILITLNRYYGFTLWMDGGKLRKRHGLFTVTEGTIPLAKVQVLIVQTTPLMRLFGWYTLEVQTMGLNTDQQGQRVVAPFAKWETVMRLADRVRPMEMPDTFERVSPLTIRRHFLRRLGVLLAALAPAVYFWPHDWWAPYDVALPWWSLLTIPLLGIAAYLHYHYHRFAIHHDGLYVRRGVLRHYLWMIPINRYQVAYATDSLLQRRLNLKTLFVDTAGASAFAYPDIVDVEAGAADQAVDTLYDQFHTLYRAMVSDVEQPAPASPPSDLRQAAAAVPRALPLPNTDPASRA